MAIKFTVKGKNEGWVGYVDDIDKEGRQTISYCSHGYNYSASFPSNMVEDYFREGTWIKVEGVNK